jgi:hypothetical protein
MSIKTPAGFYWFKDKDGGNKWVQVPRPWMGGDTTVNVTEKVHEIMFAKEPKAGPLGVAPGVEEDEVILLKDLF